MIFGTVTRVSVNCYNVFDKSAMGAPLNGFLSISAFWLLPSRHTPPMYCRLSLVSGFIARLQPAVRLSSSLRT